MEWQGGKVHEIEEGILHLMRGQIFEIEGKTFLHLAEEALLINGSGLKVPVGGRKKCRLRMNMNGD